MVATAGALADADGSCSAAHDEVAKAASAKLAEVESWLHPLTLPIFAHEHWEATPHLWNATGTDRAARHRALLPFDPADGPQLRRWAARLVTTAEKPGPLLAQQDVIFVRDGAMPLTDEHPVVPADAAVRMLGEGRLSMVVHKLAHRLPSVARLAAALEAALGLHVGANLYHTPPTRGAQALGLHCESAHPSPPAHMALCLMSYPRARTNPTSHEPLANVCACAAPRLARRCLSSLARILVSTTCVPTA